jgi:hypothetical protein
MKRVGADLLILHCGGSGQYDGGGDGSVVGEQEGSRPDVQGNAAGDYTRVREEKKCACRQFQLRREGTCRH